MGRGRRALRVETPCDNRWQELEPRDGGRWCPQCRRVVVDLVAATESEAWRAYEAADGDLCAWIRPDANGDAVFRSPGHRVSRVAAVALGAALAACEPSADTASSSETIEQPVEPPSTGETTAPPPTEAPPPAEENAPGDVAAADGSDHPTHVGEPHTAVHDRRHGRMGAVRAVPRNPRDPENDPLEGLDGL